ncbi:hypothetical protein [Bifidobacterium sp. SO1]|uniref:hypothetical protein n=1 Tax=Bifidobacterium sp. SO1 TaxID=2809029 RepID=UPI001BDC6C03|nr:hypothetical protein [Bifidobacterium sp. SO1]MBT1161814.1 hypothetical protein [Bifidobacterium sp. SO1]
MTDTMSRVIYVHDLGAWPRPWSGQDDRIIRWLKWHRWKTVTTGNPTLPFSRDWERLLFCRHGFIISDPDRPIPRRLARAWRIRNAGLYPILTIIPERDREGSVAVYLARNMRRQFMQWETRQPFAGMTAAARLLMARCDRIAVLYPPTDARLYTMITRDCGMMISRFENLEKPVARRSRLRSILSVVSSLSLPFATFLFGQGGRIPVIVGSLLAGLSVMTGPATISLPEDGE